MVGILMNHPLGEIYLVGVLEVVKNLLVVEGHWTELESFELDHQDGRELLDSYTFIKYVVLLRASCLPKKSVEYMLSPLRSCSDT